MPVGPLVARTYLFRNGEVLSAHIARVTLERKGIERVLHDFAFRYPFTYGMIAVILAVLAGLLGIGVLPPRGGVSAAAQSPFRSRAATG